MKKNEFVTICSCVTCSNIIHFRYHSRPFICHLLHDFDCNLYLHGLQEKVCKISRIRKHVKDTRDKSGKSLYLGKVHYCLCINFNLSCWKKDNKSCVFQSSVTQIWLTTAQAVVHLPPVYKFPWSNHGYQISWRNTNTNEKQIRKMPLNKTVCSFYWVTQTPFDLLFIGIVLIRVIWDPWSNRFAKKLPKISIEAKTAKDTQFHIIQTRLIL